jgi:OmpA-OmpF porin, OOP family
MRYGAPGQAVGEEVMRQPFVVLACVLFVGAAASLGHNATAAQLGRGPSTEEIIEELTPAHPPKLRGISPEDPETKAAAPASPQEGEPSATNSPAAPSTAAEPALPSIDLLVHFEFGSADLTVEARDLLDRLGAALQSSKLRNFSFRVVGHTDAIGSDESNRKLSRERADAVKAYLVKTFQVAPERLETMGLGKSQLIDPANPSSGANRRVQVVNLGSAPKTE